MKDIKTSYESLNSKAVAVGILESCQTCCASQDRLGRKVSISIAEKPEMAIFARIQASAAAKASLSFNQRLWNDVNTDSVREIAGWNIPMPGAVGPETMAILTDNATVAYKCQINAG